MSYVIVRILQNGVGGLSLVNNSSVKKVMGYKFQNINKMFHGSGG